MFAVLGFHRSLTSVVAQWLHNSGVCMGDYLMPPAASNPEGHYEDMPLVALHDDLLAMQGTTWQFSGEVELSSDAGGDAIQRYVSLRDSLHGEHWGMKDPRQCLFLPNWRQVLGERGRYLVVLRHWSVSIQSLLKRSSQDLAFGLGSPVSDSRFWRVPGHAAKVWMAYNERLLAFLEVCPRSQRLVVTQQSLMQGLELPRRVNEGLGIPLDASEPSPIKPSLVHDEVSESVKEHLTDEQIDRMSALWNRLLSYADHRVEREEPAWKPDDYSAQDRWLSHSLLSASSFEASTEPLSQPRSMGKHEPDVSDHSFGALSKLAQQEYRALKLVDAERHTRKAMGLAPGHPSEYIRLACILLVSGKAEEAEGLLAYAIEWLGEVAILLHYRATILDLLGRTEEAVALLTGVEKHSELLERQKIALLLKSDVDCGRDRFRAWSKHRSSSLTAWQKVSASLKGIESPPLRTDFAFRVARIWNNHA